MRKTAILNLLLFVVALGAILCPAASFAGKLEKINVQPTAEGVQVKLTASDRLKYKVQDFESPPRIIIQLSETEKGVPYEKFPVDQGLVTDMKVTQVMKKGAPATFVNVHLSKMARYDFDLSPDGRDFTLKIFGPAEGKAESLPPSLVDTAPYQKDWTIPSIRTPSAGAKGAAGEPTELPEYPSEEDLSPFVEGPIKVVDADASQVVQILTEAFDASIVLDKQILTDEESMKASGTPTGITLTLSNITLQDALDVVSSANGWKWSRVGDTYLILHETTDEYGYDMTSAPRFKDPAQQMDVMVFKPKYMDACRFSTYASTIIPLPTKYFHCDPSKNIAILRGTPKDLERAIKLFKELDTEEMRSRPSAAEFTKRYEEVQSFVSKVIRLKYIRAEDLYNKLNPLIGVEGSPYLGNLRLVESFGKGIMGQDGIPDENFLDNTLAFDSTTNTLIFVGREYVFTRLIDIIEKLDVPYSATIFRMVPLKYLHVDDLKSDLSTEGETSSFFTSLDEMFGRGSKVFTSPETNSITFVGTEDDYERLLQFINTVDIESREFISETIPLENLRVEDLAATQNKILGPILSTKEYGMGKAKFSYIPSNNTVVVGAQRQYMTKIIKLLKNIDVEPQDIVTKEFHLKYIKADRVLQVLKNIVAKNADMGHLQTTDDGSFFVTVGGENLPEKYQTYQSIPMQEGTFGDANKLALHAENTRNSIIVSGPKNDVRKIEQLIGIMDKPYPQIKIDVQLIELRNARDKNIGMGYVYQNKHFTGNFNFDSYPHPTDEKSAVTNHMGPVVTDYSTEQDGSPKPEYGIADFGHQITGNSGFFLYDTLEYFVKQFAPTLKALITEEVGSFIAEPSVVLGENMTAEFAFVDKIPYITGDVDPTTGRQLTVVQYEEIGFLMTIKCHFTPDGFIVLNMDPIVYKTLKGFKSFEAFGGKNEVPITGERKVDTEVKLQNGQPFIIGGFIHSIDSKYIEKVPILADLPLFGKLFKRKTTKNEDNEIVIVVTPTIIPVCHEEDLAECP
ncbi:MAG: secretin N-terminal domain-containing protein [bacterium]